MTSSASCALDPGRPVLEVEAGHPVLATLVQVQGAGVDGRERPALVDGPDHAAVAVDDAVLGRRRARPQPDRGRRRAPSGVHRPPVAQLEPVVHDQPADALVEVVAPPRLVGRRQRQLVGGAGQVGIEHERVGRVHHRRLGRPDEDLRGDGPSATGRAGPRPPPAPPPTAGAGDRPGPPAATSRRWCRGSRRGCRRRVRRRRCPARGRWWRPPPAAGRRTARPRSPAAPPPGTRPGRAGRARPAPPRRAGPTPPAGGPRPPPAPRPAGCG